MRGVIGVVALFWKFSLDEGYQSRVVADNEWVRGKWR